jgi:hypothetical protein
MRWLMIGLFVSLGALILASAGMAWHIWRQHSQLRQTRLGKEHPAILIPEESEVETEETP